MARLFGTDGVRGLANQDITAELALDLAVAAAHVLGESGEFEGHRPTAVVGTDGRASGEFLLAATVAGLASAGVDVLDAGVLPTPAIAFLTADLRADLGVMISASHNPMPDNGIKFFARGGHKLADDVEDTIEARMREPWQRPTGAGVGRLRPLADGLERYVGHLMAALPNRLDGLHVVLDTANGAASVASPEAFRRAGARVSVIGASPDGLNINDGYGSTHLDRLCEAVLVRGRRLRRRSRRRRRPVPRGRRFRHPGRRRPDHVDPRDLLARQGPSRVRHSRGHGHVEPRDAPGDGAVGHHRAPDRGRRPVRPRGHEVRRVRLGWRAERPRHPARARHHRRRRAHRADARGPGRRDRPVAHRARRR